MTDPTKPPERKYFWWSAVESRLTEFWSAAGDSREVEYILASSLPGSVEQIETAHTHIAAALDLLEFHEGSEKFIDGPDSNRVVWINAEGADGDFQVVLDLLRSALAAMKKEKP